LKTAAIYIRVSTDAQREEGYSIEAQKEQLTAFCVAKGIKKYKYYIDGGFSGSSLERPAIKELIDDVKKGKISMVLVYKLDRLSRSQKDTLYLIEDVFNPNNVDFVSLNESMDTATPMGRLMLGILSAFAQLERENIRERTRMGMLERVKNGYWMGGGKIPYGYDYDRNKGILVPNKDAKNVRKMYEMYLNGYSCQQIADIFGLKYDRIVYQILTRKTNIGIIAFRDKEYKGRHKPIIDNNTFMLTQEKINDSSQKGIQSSSGLLSGLMVCGKCGAKMHYQSWGKYGKKICCYSQQSSKKYLIKDKNCNQKKFWADEIEDIVIKDIMEFSVENRASKSIKSSDIIETLQKQEKLAEKKLKNLYNLYAENEDDIIFETISENKKELENIRKSIEKEKETKMLERKNLEIKKQVDNIGTLWPAMNKEERKRLIHLLIKRIVINDDEIKIEYTI
jgi:site-specific DNA recombinase